MAYQNILDIASSSSISSLASSGQVNFAVGGWYGWGLDLNLNSSSASGTITVYKQYTNPVGDTAVQSPYQSLPVASGTFASGYTRHTIDSLYQSTAAYLVVNWSGSDPSSGSLSFSGLTTIY